MWSAAAAFQIYVASFHSHITLPNSDLRSYRWNHSIGFIPSKNQTPFPKISLKGWSYLNPSILEICWQNRGLCSSRPSHFCSMQFLVFWALIASAGLVLCDKAVWDLDQAPRRPLCAVQGDRFLRPFLITSQGSFSVPAQCGALCKSQRLCQSYSIEAGYCRLYALPARYLSLLPEMTVLIPTQGSCIDKP